MARQTRTGRRRRMQFGTFTVMASAASAVSLNDIQPITLGTIPVTCQLAYNTPIPGCTAADFQKNSDCSSMCVTGIGIIQDTVQTLCNEVDVSRTSVLGGALNNELEITICDGNRFTVSTASVSRTPPPVQQTSTKPVVVTTSRTIGSFTPIPIPTVIPPILSSVTSIFNPIPSTTTVSPVQTTSQSTVEASTTVIISTTSDSSAQTSSVETTSDSTQTSSAVVLSTTTSGTSQILTTTTSNPAASTSSSSSGDDTRGGGSPFDTSSDASGHFGICWSQQLLATAVVIVLLLRRT